MTSRERWQFGIFKVVGKRGRGFVLSVTRIHSWLWTFKFKSSAAALSSASGPIESRLAAAVPHCSRSSYDPFQCALDEGSGSRIRNLWCPALSLCNPKTRAADMYFYCVSQNMVPLADWQKEQKTFGFPRKVNNHIIMDIQIFNCCCEPRHLTQCIDHLWIKVGVGQGIWLTSGTLGRLTLGKWCTALLVDWQTLVSSD
jgi:hypothetical protein